MTTTPLTDYERGRLEILEAFWSDMSQRLGLQAPVKASIDVTFLRLAELMRTHVEASR